MGEADLEIQVIENIGIGMVGRQLPTAAQVELVLLSTPLDPPDQILQLVLDPRPGRVVLWVRVGTST